MPTTSLPALERSKPSVTPLRFTPTLPIPADAVTASASGLDPYISLGSALAQVAPVATARGVQVEQANQLVAQFTEGPDLGLLGEPRVGH